MPVILLEGNALHVQLLQPAGERVARLYGSLGFGFYPDARAATARLDAAAAGWVLGLFEAGNPTAWPASHEDLLGLASYRFPVSKLRRITVGKRFPDLSIEVRGPGRFLETYDLSPKLPRSFGGAPTAEAIAFARAVADLFEWARIHAWPGEWTEGWLALPRAEWEKVDAFPEDVAPAAGYRTSPLRGKRIVAERGDGSTFERLVRAFLPSAKCSPRRVVLTRETIYADFRGEVFMLPRGLPVRIEEHTWIFGAFAGMTLEPRSEPCPVVEALHADRSA